MHDAIKFRPYTFLTYQGRSPIGSITFGGFHTHGQGQPTAQNNARYVLIYPVRGKARYADETGNDRWLDPGDLVILRPHVQHHYLPEKQQPWSEMWFTFTGPVFDLWRELGPLGQAATFRQLLPVEYWYQRFNVVLEMGRQPERHGALEAACALLLVLAEALGSAGGSGAAEDDQRWLRRAFTCLDTHNLAEAPRLEEVAEQLNMSYDQFRRRFTALAGMTPGHYRTARVMDYACRLIQTERLTNEQIADRCGFSSPFHFSRRFKQIVGLTPRQFRRSAEITS